MAIAATHERGRILLVRAHAEPDVENHVDAMAIGLIERGWHVGMVHPPEQQHDPRIESYGYAIGESHVLHGESDAVLKIARIMHGYDIVHAHGMRAAAYTGLAIAMSRSKLGAHVPRLITTLHQGVHGTTTNENFMTTALSRIVVDGSDHLLCVSQDIQNHVSKFGHCPMSRAIIPTLWQPRDLGSDPKTSVSALRTSIGVPPGKFMALVATSLQPKKCVDMAIDALSDFGVAKNWHLVIIGDGPRREALQAHAARLFPGRNAPISWLPHYKDVPAVIAASDALVISSQWEGKPQSLQFALRSGTPIVATCTGGIPELVGAEHLFAADGMVLARTTQSYDINGAAMLVAVDDEGAVRDALRDLTGLQFRVRMSELGRAQAQHLHTVDDALDQVEAIYSTAIARRRTLVAR